MPRQNYGTVYSLYTVIGFVWDQLEVREQSALLGQLFQKKYAGDEHDQFGFKGTRQIGEDIFYGHFSQQYQADLEVGSDPDTWEWDVRYPFEHRFFLFIPKEQLLVLEQRKFIRQPGLTMTRMAERIRKLFQDALPKYVVDLESFDHDIKPAEMREYFYRYQVVGLEADGLRDKQLPTEFVFFNPQYDKNLVSRELFDSRILPFMDSVDIKTDSYKDPGAVPPPKDDLRKNALARVATEVASDIREIAIHDPERGRKIIKPHYDEEIRISVQTSDPQVVVREVLDRINQIPDRKITIRVQLSNQLKLSDLEPGT